MFSDNFCHKDVAQCKREDTTHSVNNNRNFFFRERNSKTAEIGILLRKKKANV